MEEKEMRINREKETRLFACDYAEHLLPMFESLYPRDNRPRQAIMVSRQFAHGRKTQEELDAARDAANAASSAAWTAARAATRVAASAARAAAKDATKAANAATKAAASDAAKDAARAADWAVAASER